MTKHEPQSVSTSVATHGHMNLVPCSRCDSELCHISELHHNSDLLCHQPADLSHTLHRYIDPIFRSVCISLHFSDIIDHSSIHIATYVAIVETTVAN